MRKILTFLLFLTQLNLSFAQEKIPLVFPNDSIFEVNDSVNKLPLVQLRYYPISFNFGQYYTYNSAELNEYNRIDLNVCLNFKKINIDLDYNSSEIYSFNFDGITSVENAAFGNLHNFKLNFGYRIFSRSYIDNRKIILKTCQNELINISKIKKHFFSKSYHNIFIVAGFSEINNVNPKIVSKDYIYTDSTSSNKPIDHYKVAYFYGGNQKLINIGLKYNNLKNVSISSENCKGFYLSNLNLYSYLSIVVKDDLIFSTITDANNVGNYTSTNYFESLQYDKYTGEIIINDKSIDSKKFIGNSIGNFYVNFGFDFQLSRKNSFFSFIGGYNFKYFSGYKTSFYENNIISSNGDVFSGVLNLKHPTKFNTLKFGMLFQIPNWKK